MVPLEVSSLGLDSPKLGLDGQDIDDMPEMIKLTAEIDKINSINPAAPVNWNLVEQCSRIVLRDYVKHFLVAAYYGTSLIRIEGSISAVACGASVFAGIFSAHWKDALPPAKRKKGRFNALQFWIDNAYSFVDSYSGEPVAQSVMDECQEILRELDSAVAEIDENDGPNLRPLISSLRNIQTFDDSAPAEPETPAEETSPAEKEPEKTEKAPEVADKKQNDSGAQPHTPKTVFLSSPSAPVVVPKAENADEKCRIAFNFLVEAADELFAADPFSVEAFTYRRIGSWMKIKALPSNDRGLTRLPAPPDEIREAIEKLYIGNQYETLIKTCEGRTTQYLFWLDLSFYSAYAAEKLGHRDVSDAIAASVSFFLSRFPDVTGLKFENGIPMCCPDTKEWLMGFSKNNESGSTNSDTVKTRINDIVDLVKTDLPGGVQQLESYVRNSSGIDMLRYEAALAWIFASVKRTDLSTGLMNRVLDRIREHSLVFWNVDACAEIFSRAFDVYRQADMLKEASSVLADLAELSPVIALTKKYTEE